MRVKALSEPYPELLVRFGSFPPNALQIFGLKRPPRDVQTIPATDLTVRDSHRHCQVAIDVLLSLFDAILNIYVIALSMAIVAHLLCSRNLLHLHFPAFAGMGLSLGTLKPNPIPPLENNKMFGDLSASCKTGPKRHESLWAQRMAAPWGIKAKQGPVRVP